MGNKIEKVIGVLPITNRICYGKVDKEKKLWVGNREDVTDMAISAVFDWFFNQMDGKDEFSICYPDVPGMKLKMIREE